MVITPATSSTRTALIKAGNIAYYCQGMVCPMSPLRRCLPVVVLGFLLAAAGAGCADGGAVRGFGGPESVPVGPEASSGRPDDAATLPDDAGVSPGGSADISKDGAAQLVDGGVATDPSSFAAMLFDAANSARAAAGLPPLTAEPCAEPVALQRAKDLVGAPELVHAPMSDLIQACAVTDGVSGENLVRGVGTPLEFAQAWLASPTHRANLLDPQFQSAALACVLDPTEAATVGQPEMLCSHVFLD